MKHVFLLILSLASVSAFADASWKLSGSTTVAGVLEAHQAEIEAKSGRNFIIESTSSLHGLGALAAGKTDLAMISSPLDEIAKAVNSKHPGAVVLEDYRATAIGSVKLRFIVHPKNTVRKLSQSQLSDILTGKTANWSEVGGPDSPILLVSLASAGSLVREKVTHGADFRKDGRLVNSADQISTVVAQNTEAIGIISDAHKRGLTSFLETDVDITAPLFLVTKGEPGPDQAKFFDAIKSALSAAH